MTPFFVEGGEHPLVPADFLDPNRAVSDTPTVESFISKMNAILQLARDKLKEAQDTQKAYVDKQRREKTFVVGDLVMVPTTHLLQDNIAQRPNASLRHPYVGPFKIAQVMSPVTYRLRLPPTVRAHPVMHVSVLKRYNPRPGQMLKFGPQSEVRSAHDKYEVEAILDEHVRYHKKQYLVKWIGFANYDNTWLSEKNMVGCEKLLEEFRARKSGLLPASPSTPSSPLVKPAPLSPPPASPSPPPYSSLPKVPLVSPPLALRSATRTSCLRREDSVRGQPSRRPDRPVNLGRTATREIRRPDKYRSEG